MSSSIPEVGQCPFTGDAAGAPGLSLVERAEGLSRAAVMKDVLGPHLDAMMRPIYAPEIEPEEGCSLPSLEGGFPLRVLNGFSRDASHLLLARFRESVEYGEEYEQFIKLSDSRKDLLYFAADYSRIFKEAVGTSVSVPLKVAAQISCLEGDKDPVARYRILHADALTEIMERQSFDETLLRLTKGPNEFLGEGSDQLNAGDMAFFNFAQGAITMTARRAFDMEDGRVTRLSDAYFVAAEQRRQKLRSFKDNRHQGNDSSGCPVRHSFEGASDEPQEPLIITGKKFVIAALRHAEQIPI